MILNFLYQGLITTEDLKLTKHSALGKVQNQISILRRRRLLYYRN